MGGLDYDDRAALSTGGGYYQSSSILTQIGFGRAGERCHVSRAIDRGTGILPVCMLQAMLAKRRLWLRRMHVVLDLR